MSTPTHSQVSVDPIHLDFQSVQQVVVTDDDGDRWCLTVREAAFACRAAQDDNAWREEFEAFLAHINVWAKAHADVVVAAYVGISSEGLTGVIVTSGPEYRLDFDDEVTALDIELANQFPNCRADVLQCPQEDSDPRIPYIAMEKAVQVYGQRK